MTDPKRPLLRPYLIRSGYSFVVARISDARVEEAPPGVEPAQLTTLTLQVVESWYGPAFSTTLRIVLDEPASPIARLRTPHPYWGAAPTTPGTLVLLWFQPAEPGAGDLSDLSKRPFGVMVHDSGPDIEAARDVLAAELGSTEARRSRYLGYLAAGHPVTRLFGIEALGGDDLGPDADGQVAGALARALAREKELFLRVAIATAAGAKPYAGTTPAGRGAILVALLLGAGDASPDLRTTCLDVLADLKPFDLDELPTIRSARAREALSDRAREEDDASVAERFVALAAKVAE
jgi:hypothetical protein